jgi:hypothetical protein
MLKVTVDLEAAKEFISRYFSGKGIRVDEVEIILPIITAYFQPEEEKKCPPIEPDPDLMKKRY